MSWSGRLLRTRCSAAADQLLHTAALLLRAFSLATVAGQRPAEREALVSIAASSRHHVVFSWMMARLQVGRDTSFYPPRFTSLPFAAPHLT